MNCQTVNELIHAYLDKQLDAANAMQVESHLAHCQHCARTLKTYSTLSTAIREGLPYHSAPSNLRNRILTHIEPVGDMPPTRQVPIIKYLVGGLSFAASLILGIVLFSNYQHQLSEEQLLNEILSGHVRALTADRLTDIHTEQAAKISPWFTSRLDYSPKIFNLAEQGYTLLGGRLDSLQDRRIASLTYQYKHHIINLYTWPSPEVDDAPQEIHTRQGYSLLYWCQNNMNYWVVSDLDDSEVAKFANIIHAKVATPPHE